MAENTQETTGSTPDAGTITVSCGSNSIPHGAGMSVADLRNKLKKVISIGPDTRALVNGAVVEGETAFIVQAGMSLEFVKEAGVKGAC